jgi:YidC/Oxa1 family membrane protein insertase
VPLGSHWLSGAGILSLHGVVFVGVLAILAAACWFVARAARRAMPQPAPTSPASGSAARGSAAPAVAVPGSQALAAFGKIAPYITVVIAAFAPLAGVIYLVTSTSWSAAERLVFVARSKSAAPQGQTVGAERKRPATT